MDGIKVQVQIISGERVHRPFAIKFDRRTTPSLHVCKTLAVCRYLGQYGPFISFEFTKHGMLIAVSPDRKESVIEFTVHLEDHNGKYTKV